LIMLVMMLCDYIDNFNLITVEPPCVGLNDKCPEN